MPAPSCLASPAERQVRDAGHRRQDHRCGDSDATAQVDWSEVAARNCGVGMTLAHHLGKLATRMPMCNAKPVGKNTACTSPAFHVPVDAINWRGDGAACDNCSHTGRGRFRHPVRRRDAEAVPVAGRQASDSPRRRGLGWICRHPATGRRRGPDRGRAGAPATPAARARRCNAPGKRPRRPRGAGDARSGCRAGARRRATADPVGHDPGAARRPGTCTRSNPRHSGRRHAEAGGRRADRRHGAARWPVPRADAAGLPLSLSCSPLTAPARPRRPPTMPRSWRRRATRWRSSPAPRTT